MSTKEKAPVHLGIKLSIEEKEFIESGAKKYKMSMSDYSRRVLRLATERDLVKEDFLSPIEEPHR